MYIKRGRSKRVSQFLLIGLCIAMLGMLSKNSKIPTYTNVSEDPIDIIEPEITRPEIFAYT